MTRLQFYSSTIESLSTDWYEMRKEMNNSVNDSM